MRPLRLRNSSVSIANHIFSALARLAGGGDHVVDRRTATPRACAAASAIKPEPAGGGGGVDHVHAVAALAVALELLGRLARRLVRAREAARDVDRHDVVARGEERLVDGDEVADGRLGGGGQLLGAAQLLEERRVVGDVGLPTVRSPPNTRTARRARSGLPPRSSPGRYPVVSVTTANGHGGGPYTGTETGSTDLDESRWNGVRSEAERAEEIAAARSQRRSARAEEGCDEGELADYDQHPADTGHRDARRGARRDRRADPRGRGGAGGARPGRVASTGDYGKCVDCGKDIPPSASTPCPKACAASKTSAATRPGCAPAGPGLRGTRSR